MILMEIALKISFHYNMQKGNTKKRKFVALKKGLVLRSIGNVLYFIPPYIINKEEIEFMVNICFGSIEEYFQGKGTKVRKGFYSII